MSMAIAKPKVVLSMNRLTKIFYFIFKIKIKKPSFFHLFIKMHTLTQISVVVDIAPKVLIVLIETLNK
jgi:hypothetical protein